MKTSFDLNVIISALTGGLYHKSLAPTELFADLSYYLTYAVDGQGHFAYTDELPALMDRCRENIYGACKPELEEIIRNWDHSHDWEERIENLQKEFGNVEFAYP